MARLRAAPARSPVPPSRVIVTDQPESIGQVFEELARLASRHRVPVRVRREVQVALEEVLSNVGRHGRRGGRLPKVTVEKVVEQGVLVVEVSDDGPAFDPLAVPDPRVDLPVTDRPIGGLGIYLVKRLVDAVTYQRRGRSNLLVMRKAIPTTSRTRCD